MSHHGYRPAPPPVRDEELPPPILTPGYLRPDQIPGEWLLLRTLTQHEKRVIGGLHAQGLGFFFPYNTVPGRRKRVTYQAMFAGYVFVTADARDYLDCPEMEPHLLARGCRYLSIPSQSRFLADIASLHIVTEAGANCVTSPIRVKGERVTVVGRHPMKGAFGWVESWDPHGVEVFINVTVMGQSARIMVAEEFLLRVTV